MSRNEVERRYHDDPVFRQLVDIIGAHIDRLALTPMEVREAAMLACINHEMWRTRAYEISAPMAEEARRNIGQLNWWLDSLEPPK